LVGIEVQEVSFATKKVSCHLDFIYPFQLANNPKIYKLPDLTRMYPVLFFSFFRLYFGISLVFWHILGPQDVRYLVQVIKSS